MPEIPDTTRLAHAPNGSTPAAQPPVFILTASRSGSTLLRFILDSHPDLACGPETNVASMCAQVARTWDILENADADSARSVHDTAELAPEAITAIRDAADRVYGRYLQRRGKRRWCDKSLDSYQHAELISQVFPEAKFLCLYRHAMDMIASGIEACPWGVHRYGFDPFVAQHPGNDVGAIGSYWLTTVQAILAFERKHPDSCHRVRYEDLATAPEDTVAAIFSFLGAEQAPGITRQCFDVPHDGNGPGDEKIWFTSEVAAASLGRGVEVPSAALPRSVIEPMNDALGELDYRLVDEKWNAAIGRVDPRARPAEAAADKAVAAADKAAAPERPDLAPAIQALSERMRSRADAELREIAARWPTLAGQTVALVVQGAEDSHAGLHWQFRPELDGGPGPEANGDGRPGHNGHEQEPVATFIASPDVWRSLLGGEVNLITEIMAGRMRCINQRDDHRLRTDELHAVAALLGLTRIPVARAS